MEAHIKELLRRDGVKLWLPPYTVASRQSGSYSSDMLSNYSRETGRPIPEVEKCLESLRQFALSRLNANKKFQEKGVATLYMSKVTVKQNSNSQSAPSSWTKKEEGSAKNEIPIECQLSILGSDLRGQVAAALSVSKDDFRMIAHARLIEDNRVLHSQGVEHGICILCIMLTDEERQTLQEQSWKTEADRTRDAVKRLMKSNSAHNIDYLQILDQHGNPLRLPEEERVALALAMALHDKGRKALKQRQYGKALLYLVEADKEFDLCRSDILHLVDNYAILCLDIVWCYLRLQSVTSLPDAERRLRMADEGFRRSYGPNFERLANIRKGIMHEKALILRLKLLQGALAYFQRRYRCAHEYFVKVSKEIQALEVDDAKLSQMVAMGYSAAEARLGLRASSGNIEGALQHIIQQREDEERREKERKQQEKEGRLQKRFGKTPSGKWIDVETYDKLVGMGFGKRAAGTALVQAENDMNAALEILRVTPQTQLPGGDIVNAIEEALFERQDPYDPQQIKDLITSLGFPADVVTEAVRLHPDDLVGAAEALLSSNAQGPFSAFVASNPDLRDTVMRVVHQLQELQQLPERTQNRPRSSSGTGGEQSAQEDDGHQAAYKQLEEDISQSLHEHLDTTFEEELQVLELMHPLIITHLS